MASKPEVERISAASRMVEEGWEEERERRRENVNSVMVKVVVEVMEAIVNLKIKLVTGVSYIVAMVSFWFLAGKV